MPDDPAVRSWSSAPAPAAEDRLPSLAVALDPEPMKHVLSPHLEERFGPGSAIEELSIHVYRRHVNRCVVRYQVLCRVNGGERRTWSVFGKVLAEDRGRPVYETMRSLWSLGFDRGAPDGISMPEPIAYLPALSMLLQEAVDGEAARALIRQSPGAGPSRMAARALAKLHRCGLPPGPPRGVEDALRRCHPRHPFLALACPEVADSVRTIVERSFAIEACLGRVEVTPLHGDFHLGQVHIDGPRAWLVDFDAVGHGDPASDVGNLSVFLKDKARHRPQAARLLDEFLGEYFTHMDPAIAARLPLYEALTHLRRACKRLRLQGPGWRERVGRMMERGMTAIASMERNMGWSGGPSAGPRRGGDG